MSTEYDERTKNYSKLSYGSYIVEMVDYEGLEAEVRKLNIMPLPLRVFMLSNSKRVINNFIHTNNGFCP